MPAVDGLTPSQVLILYSPFEPVPLLRVVEGRGFGPRCRQSDGGDWAIRFEPHL